MRKGLLTLVLASIAVWTGRAGAVGEQSEDFERSILLRSKGDLHISNNRGDLVIDGYSQDRVRVRGKRIAKVDSAEEAKKLFAALDVRTRSLDEVTEVSAEYGRGLTLQERLQERQNPRTRMNLQIQAPSSRTLRLWSVDGKVMVRNWKGPIEVRANSGTVILDHVRGDVVSVLCPACEVRANSIHGQVRMMGGSGSITLSEVVAPNIYIETAGGVVRTSQVRADQLYVSKSGALKIEAPHGRVEFQTQEAPVEVVNGDGFVSGRTSSGNMTIRMRRWKFEDKALFETISGKIELELPRRFQGEVDARSPKGSVDVEFPLLRSDRGDSNLPLDPHHRYGRVGDGGELLRLVSEEGDIRVISGKDQ